MPSNRGLRLGGVPVASSSALRTVPRRESTSLDAGARDLPSGCSLLRRDAPSSSAASAGNGTCCGGSLSVASSSRGGSPLPLMSLEPRC
eukprot:2207109-Pyramimonas_sp.AAC.1